MARGRGQQHLATGTLAGDTVVALGSAVTVDGVSTLVVRLGPDDLAPALRS